VLARIIQNDVDGYAQGSEEKREDAEQTRRPEAMLTYMKPELIEAAKDAAASNDQKAWQFIEKAVERALKSKRA
jgi:hypothetical protein